MTRDDHPRVAVALNRHLDICQEFPKHPPHQVTAETAIFLIDPFRSPGWRPFVVPQFIVPIKMAIHEEKKPLDQCFGSKKINHPWLEMVEIQKYIPAINMVKLGMVYCRFTNMMEILYRNSRPRGITLHLTLGFLGILGAILGTFCLGRGAKLSSSVIKRGWKLICKQWIFHCPVWSRDMLLYFQI